MCNTIDAFESFTVGQFSTINTNLSVVGSAVGSDRDPGSRAIDLLANGSYGLHAIDDDVLATKTAVNDLATQENTHYDLLSESLEAAEAAAVSANANTAAIIATQTAQTILSGFTSLAKFAGGGLAISLAELLGQLINNPPYNLLSLGPANGIVTGTQIVGALGVYGLKLTFTVPAGWGKMAGSPLQYVPFVARMAWGTADGFVDNPIEIVTSPVVAWPAPTNADRLTVALQPGITGTWQQLRL